MVSTEAIDDEKELLLTDSHGQERKLLWQVLGINAFFFVLEVLAGFLAHSMGLVADGLDMLADSIVYATARQVRGVVWTQDEDFKDLPDVEYVPKRRRN